MSGFIFDKMLQGIYLAVYSAVAEFFELMGNMGADMFGLEWVKATVKLFGLFGWSLFAAVTLCYGFLTIRMDDTTVLDFMRYAVKYLISAQQYFEWG